jgi:quinol monooxygenase YgiN
MMPHVTFFRFKALPGRRQAVIDHFEKWERDQKPKATGFERSVLAASNGDGDEFMGVVRWDNTANYVKNSNRPEQDAWFRELRANLVADPEWFDGTLERESMA